MKKYFSTALVLTLIAAICAALIASVNLLTSSIIEKNNLAKIEALNKEIFAEYDGEKSQTYTEGFTSEYISQKVEVCNSNGDFLGYIYTVGGSNSYGEIVLLVGITEDLKLKATKFVTNGQSFSSEAETHLNTQYNPDITIEDILDMDLSNSDVTAGATYAAKLIRSLVSAAFDDAKGGASNGTRS